MQGLAFPKIESVYRTFELASSAFESACSAFELLRSTSVPLFTFESPCSLLLNLGFLLLNLHLSLLNPDLLLLNLHLILVLGESRGLIGFDFFFFISGRLRGIASGQRGGVDFVLSTPSNSDPATNENYGSCEKIRHLFGQLTHRRNRVFHKTGNKRYKKKIT